MFLSQLVITFPALSILSCLLLHEVLDHLALALHRRSQFSSHWHIPPHSFLFSQQIFTNRPQIQVNYIYWSPRFQTLGETYKYPTDKLLTFVWTSLRRLLALRFYIFLFLLHCQNQFSSDTMLSHFVQRPNILVFHHLVVISINSIKGSPLSLFKDCVF